MEYGHEPVMTAEVLELLKPGPGGTYCDATLGAGGHSQAILDASSPTGRVIGLDRDPSALTTASARLAPYGERVQLIHGELGDLPRILAEVGAVPVDGFVLDLGVRSEQIDRPERGFSFRPGLEGPLDMRMDPTSGETASELLRRVSVHELEEILREFGEERFAKRVARAIKEACHGHQLHSTKDLATVVARAIPSRERKKDPATRTFQALRIAVNRELEQLERFLDRSVEVVRPGGRIVILAYHSLEDRIVKHRFRSHPDLEVLTKRPLRPTEAECARNPRSRSAKLRAAERAILPRRERRNRYRSDDVSPREDEA